VEYIRQIGGPNGRASGNRIEEAVLHALLEVFERRAHITVLRNRLVMPTIALDSIRNPVVRNQIDCLRARDIEITLKDLSFEGNLPCIGAYFADSHVSRDVQFHHFFKVGCSFDHEEALLRIFTEYTQGRRAHEFGEGVEIEQVDFRRLPTHPAYADNFLSAFMFGMVPFRDAAFLCEGEVVPFDPGIRFDDCLADIEAGVGICRAIGKDCLVVDQTDPAFGFPVVQVVVPGYSDILPYHPHASPVLFAEWTRDHALQST
jgi:ribosomal protein S12 methylthiotransferase accessory factor